MKLKYMVTNIFKTKNCLISGATGGIGREIALEFARKGCNVILTSRNADKLSELKEKILSYTDNKVKVYVVQGDLNKLEDIKAIINYIRKEKLDIEILINSAGIFPVKPLEESTLADYESVFNLHVRSAFIFAKEFSKDMKKKQWGRIVNIGSSSAYDGFPETSLYCASKHALLGLSKSLGKELKFYNIRTYFISPSGTKTEMGKRIKGQDYETFLDPIDIAKYISFIISFDSEIITDEVRLNRYILK